MKAYRQKLLDRQKLLRELTSNLSKIEYDAVFDALKDDYAVSQINELEYLVVAMSFTRKEANKTLESLVDPIVEHLLKVLWMPKRWDVIHWVKELMGYRKKLSNRNRAKTKAPNFTKEKLQKYIIDSPLENMGDLALHKKNFEEEYTVKLPNPSLREVHKLANAFIVSILTNNDDWRKGLDKSK